ncbi:hypothetical protein PanWU01x14_086020 [Parasponia andersonii]|uniref:Uncharacterized protein n=1 Tax=Parasponia andersonii TaxID=3476 RepID=A0A2P5D967_PARAD|nr:hypothetical protein PanWU01x14_086020 [Parasponia andersonii]
MHNSTIQQPSTASENQLFASSQRLLLQIGQELQVAIQASSPAINISREKLHEENLRLLETPN